jgi:toxin ParE1/3/4
MSYTVIFTPEAEAQLIELYRYIASAKPSVVACYTDSIVTISGPAYASRTTENAL